MINASNASSSGMYYLTSDHRHWGYETGWPASWSWQMNGLIHHSTTPPALGVDHGAVVQSPPGPHAALPAVSQSTVVQQVNGRTSTTSYFGLPARLSQEQEYSSLVRIGKRCRPNPPLLHAPACQAQGCMADLSLAKHYHRRHKVCEFHSKATTVTTGNGHTQRFCQQCSRFHPLSEFDDGKRSCRRRLADHNRRRRKPQPPAGCKAEDNRAEPNNSGSSCDNRSEQRNNIGSCDNRAEQNNSGGAHSALLGDESFGFSPK